MERVKMTGMADSALATSRIVVPATIAQITQKINFAPTAPGKKSTLRSWERQSSTPFLARHKSRKIWKRFRKSMEAIRSRTAPSAASSRIDESEFMNEISQSANAAYLRAVKRQRVLRAHPERGGSFLETKWELEIGRRKRKLVGQTGEEQSVANGQEDENEADGDIPEQSLEEISQSVGMSAAVDSGEDDEDIDGCAVISEIVDMAVDAQGGQVAADFREFITKKETNLVRSALRMNSLDGEDAALLSEFLSRAQAKRAANAAMAGEVKSVAQRKKEEGQTLGSPAVQSRRALEELDVNSPSIKQSATPEKVEKLPESPDAAGPIDDTDQLTSSPTVARRRSSRTKPSEHTRSIRPAVPNQIPVRRANGTEFVFLQRTEAQELALATRKNTRRNKGNALLPRYLLQAIVKQERKDETTQPLAQIEGKDESRPSRKRTTGPKQVCWREDQLVEYAPEKRSSPATESPSPSKKKSGSLSRRQGDKSTSVTTHALPATPSKKVRRISMAASNTTTDDTAQASNKPVPMGTPIPKRKKLTPRLKTSTTAAVAAAAASGDSLSDHSSKGSLPSAVAKKASKQTAPIAQPPASKISGIPRSKTLVKPGAPSTSTSIPSAGATPMLRRVRPRRAV